MELRTVDENKLVLTVRLASNSADAAGWTRLGMVASRQMQAKFGPDVTIADRDLSVVPLAVSLELALPAKVGSVLPALPEGEPLAKGAALRGTKKAESNGNLSTKRRI